MTIRWVTLETWGIDPYGVDRLESSKREQKGTQRVQIEANER